MIPLATTAQGCLASVVARSDRLFVATPVDSFGTIKRVDITPQCY